MIRHVSMSRSLLTTWSSPFNWRSIDLQDVEIHQKRDDGTDYRHRNQLPHHGLKLKEKDGQSAQNLVIKEDIDDVEFDLESFEMMA